MWELKDIFQEMDVDVSKIIFGRGCNRRKDPRNRQDRYYINTDSSKQKVEYIIQYCKDINQYIVWTCKDVPRRRVCSVIADNVPIVEDDSIKSTRKGIEFAWREKEDVYTFNKSGIRNFAKIVILPEQEC